MTEKALLFIPSGRRNDDQLNPLVPRHSLVAKATRCRFVTHWAVQP
jgi:hypothetical protein